MSCNFLQHTKHMYLSPILSCLFHHPPPASLLNPTPWMACHRPLLHLSCWCIGSLQKVTTQGLLTPGCRDGFAQPTCWPPAEAQHFTPILLSLRLLSSLIEWRALPALLLPGLMSHTGGSFSCGLCRCHSYLLLIMDLFSSYALHCCWQHKVWVMLL